MSASCYHPTLFLTAEGGTEYGNKHTYNMFFPFYVLDFITVIITVSVCIQFVGIGTLFHSVCLGTDFRLLHLVAGTSTQV